MSLHAIFGQGANVRGGTCPSPGIYLNIGHIDFLVNVRMLKFESELRYGIRSPNVRTPVDIPTN